MKYVSGRVKELKVGLSSYSESKTTLITVGNVNVSGSVTATTFFGDGSSLTGIAATDNVRTNSLVVSGVSTFNGAIDANAQIVGAATSNIIPFLYSNYSLFPSATTYHGAVAHAHNTGKLYYAHGGNWIELVSQETTGTVGTGTERYNIGPVDLTTLDVSGISTFAGNINANGNIVGDNSTNISGINSVTATTFYGNGANLTGIDATALKDAGGNVKIQANPFGAVHTGISTFDVVSVGGTSTFLGNVGVGTAVATDPVKSSNTTKVAAGIVTAYNIFSDNYFGDSAGNFITGNTSGSSLTIGCCNVLIGNCVGAALTNGFNNVFIGENAGKSIDYDYQSVLIGSEAGCSLTDNDYRNVGLGYRVFSGKTGGNYNVGLGYQAGREDNPSVTNNNSVNINIGLSAGRVLSDGCCNVMIGKSAGYYMYGCSTENNDNVFIGSYAGRRIGYSGGCDVKCNIVLGYNAGYQVNNGPLNSVSENIFVGTCAGMYSCGACNIYIGTRAAAAYSIGDVVGDNNIGIGQSIRLPKKSGSSQLAIGQQISGVDKYWIVGNSSYNVGIGTTNPDITVNQGNTQKLAVGILTAYNIFSTKEISVGENVKLGAAGVITATTFKGDVDAVNIDVDGRADIDDLIVTGVSTFSGAIDSNAGANIAGGLVANSAQISDLTDNRVVVAGTGGELEDSTNLTFDGSTLSIIGDATFTGNVTVGGTLTSEDKTNIDSIGIVTARTGVRINSGGLVVTAGVSTFSDAIDSNNGANISGGAGLVASTAKISDLTSGRVVVAGTAGELEDSGSFTFSGGTVTATAFAGDGSALTGITASGLGAIGGLTIKDEGVVVGTAGSVSTIDFRGGLVNVIATAGAAGVATATITSESNPTFAMLNVTGVSTFQSAVGITSDVTISSTDTSNSAGPIVNLYRNSSSPANGDYLGQLKFQGESDTGATRNYAKITGKISDASNGNEDGILEFAFLKAGSQNINARFKSTELMIMNGTDFSVDGDSTFTGDITANGNIAGDGATNISGMNDVTASNFNSTSDAKLKTNVETITSPLEKLNQIDGVSFNWISDNKPSMGVIADTVEKVLPELVTSDDPKTVNYNGLIGLLIEAVKEQQVQITELKSKLDSLS